MEYITNSTELTAVANAIRSKGGTSDSLSFPAGFVSAIENIPTGGSHSVKNLVFIDYDGSEVSSYTTQEALALAALPANPSHTGLTTQGWNWSLANIKSYLTDYPDAIVYVGQMYIADDGKTRICITLSNPAALSPYLAIAVNGEISVDWGDGSTPDTMTGASDNSLVYRQHIYDGIGSYVISIEAVSGSFTFYARGSVYASCLFVSNSSGDRDYSGLYSNAITKIIIGNNAYIGAYAFANCRSLSSITIPDSVTSIGTYAFNGCYSLLSITIPDSVTSIGTYAFTDCRSLSSVTIPDSATSIGTYAFNGCYSLLSITIPDSVTDIGAYVFSGCYSLLSITIPDSVTRINNYVFYSCHRLTSITIPDSVVSIGDSAFTDCRSLPSITIPDSVTSIGRNILSGCYSLSSITIPDSVTSIGVNTFVNCRSLSSIIIPDSITSIGDAMFSSCSLLSSITIPDSVTDIGVSAFNGCSSLSFITIPDGVTSIGNSAFQNCRSLTSITIPDSVRSIGSNTFYNCYGVLEYHLKPTTPPILVSTNAFYGIVPDTIIYVPYSADHSILEAYKTYTNWSAYASKMQEEPQI